MNKKRNRDRICDFIGWTLCFDKEVTKPLSHIAPNYELSWNKEDKKFGEEELSFAYLLNFLIDELAGTPSYKDYHKFVDDELLASKFAKEEIYLQGKLWKEVKSEATLKPQDLGWYLEQKTMGGGSQENLMKSITSRIRTAQKHGIKNWDELDAGHRKMLAELFQVLLYNSSNNPTLAGQYIWETNEEFSNRLMSVSR